jgi:hypothetical protein
MSPYNDTRRPVPLHSSAFTVGLATTHTQLAPLQQANVFQWTCLVPSRYVHGHLTSALFLDSIQWDDSIVQVPLGFNVCQRRDT